MSDEKHLYDPPELPPIPSYDEATSSRHTSTARRGPNEVSDDAERQGLLSPDVHVQGSGPARRNGYYHPPSVQSVDDGDSELGSPVRESQDEEQRQIMEEMDILDPESADDGRARRNRSRSRIRDLPVSEKHAHAQRRPSSRRRMCGADDVIFFVVLFLIASTIWFSEVRTLFSGQKHACGKPLTVEERAVKILQENPLIDGHNDLMIFIRGTYKNHIYNESGSDFADKFENGGLAQHVDIPRLQKGLQGGAFWSAFWLCPLGDETNFADDRYYDIVKATLGQLDLFNRLGQNYPKYFTPSRNSAEAIKAFESGNFIAPAAIEGLHQIGNSVSTLRLYYQLGVRYATLTWNCHNKYADAAIETGSDFSARIAKPYWKGLSPAGRDLVKEMNRLGMLVDLAHVSQDTMRDVLVGRGDGNWTGSIAPPIFSHSSAHAICPHPRNVPDDILQLVKQRNSVVMVNFNPDFVSCKASGTPNSFPEFVPENNTLAHVVRHIRHIGELIGYDHVGIGTDYDGIEKTPKGLEDVSKFPDLIAELLRQGISDEDAAKIAGGNLLRVWGEADKVAKELQKTTLPLEDDVQNQWAYQQMF